IICGDDLFNRNDLVEFSDIFDYFQLQSADIPSQYELNGKTYDLLSDADDFMKVFNEIGKMRPLSSTERRIAEKTPEKNPKLTKRLEQEQFHAQMYLQILRPCLNLLDAISKMKYDKNNKRKKTDLKTAGQESLDIPKTGTTLHAREDERIR